MPWDEGESASDGNIFNRQYVLNYDAGGKYFRSNLVVGFHFVSLFSVGENFFEHPHVYIVCTSLGAHNFKMKLRKVLVFCIDAAATRRREISAVQMHSLCTHFYWLCVRVDAAPPENTYVI